MVLVAGFGNPLLDLTVKIYDDILLKKYNLNEDDQSEFEGEGQMKSLLQDIATYPIEYSPGGCAQNTLRIFQWLLNSPNSTMMFGVVGNDKQGERLKALVESANVQTRYVINNDRHTGISVALVKGENRSLVAYIGAAELMNIENFNVITNNGAIFDKVDLFYMEGFFLPERKDVAKYILKCCKDKKKLFAFNISARYICEYDAETVKYFAEECDIIVGNKREYEALGKVFCKDIDTKELVIEICNTYVNENWTYKKIAVVTNGSDSVMCVHSKGRIEEISVPKMIPGTLKDTTGAGDAFAAGFLFGIFNDRQPIDCLKLGCWTSQQIIQQVGCTIPDYAPTINT